MESRSWWACVKGELDRVSSIRALATDEHRLKAMSTDKNNRVTGLTPLKRPSTKRPCGRREDTNAP